MNEVSVGSPLEGTKLPLFETEELRFVPVVGFIANKAAEGAVLRGAGCWSNFCLIISL